MATLLVCDSDPMCLDLFNKMLRSHNVKAELVTNSQEAIEKFIDNRGKTCCDTKFRLVVMDLNLPNDKGFTALEKIMEHQRTVKLGKKRENKKKLMNNYLKSIQDSERSSVFSVKKKVASRSKGSK